MVKKPVKASKAKKTVKTKVTVTRKPTKAGSGTNDVQAWREAKEWEKIIDKISSVKRAISDSEKATFCRAVYHLGDKTSPKVRNAVALYASDIQAVEAFKVDAYLCCGRLALLDGDSKKAADMALQALKASNYKDVDAIAFIQQAHGSSAKQEDFKDHYAALHVTSSAPLEVIKAAHQALAPSVKGEALIAADEAFKVLTNDQLRAQYDSLLSHRKSGGGGKEFSGGSELLKQLGEALGLSFPTGFEFPKNGRFQGGFGGGFEFTWGDEGCEGAPAK